MLERIVVYWREWLYFWDDGDLLWRVVICWEDCCMLDRMVLC
jgi:hypothetical protein